jgi:hypothetical protein
MEENTHLFRLISVHGPRMLATVMRVRQQRHSQRLLRRRIVGRLRHVCEVDGRVVANGLQAPRSVELASCRRIGRRNRRALRSFDGVGGAGARSAGFCEDAGVCRRPCHVQLAARRYLGEGAESGGSCSHCEVDWVCNWCWAVGLNSCTKRSC